MRPFSRNSSSRSAASSWVVEHRPRLTPGHELTVWVGSHGRRRSPSRWPCRPRGPPARSRCRRWRAWRASGSIDWAASTMAAATSGVAGGEVAERAVGLDVANLDRNEGGDRSSALRSGPPPSVTISRIGHRDYPPAESLIDLRNRDGPRRPRRSSPPATMFGTSFRGHRRGHHRPRWRWRRATTSLRRRPWPTGRSPRPGRS